jgi:hypothetical protein
MFVFILDLFENKRIIVYMLNVIFNLVESKSIHKIERINWIISIPITHHDLIRQN